MCPRAAAAQAVQPSGNTATLPALPEEQKQDILTSIKTFSAFKQHRKEASTADDRDMLKAMVLMFCGPPGTDKTMMVNAAVNWLGKKEGAAG